MKWLLFAALAAAMVGAVRFRRALNDPESDFGRWFEDRVRPRLKDVVMGVFLITFLIWAAVYVTAPEDARDELSRSMKVLWETLGDDDPGPERAPGPKP